MFRHLPILLIIFATTSAHAEERGFIEQLLGSLKSKSAATTTESAGEVSGSTANESEPLALQPTTTRPRYKKRSHASGRHRQTAPPRELETHAESKPVSPEENPPPAAAQAAVPHDPLDNSASVEKTVPLADESNVLPPPAVWPNSTPAPVAPWPIESPTAPWPIESPTIDSTQNDRPVEVQAESRQEADLDAQTVATQAAQEIQSDSFLDPQRAIWGGFSATWLVLGIGMFVFRRQLATILDAGHRRREREMAVEAQRVLSFILRSAADETTVVEKIGDAGTHAVPAGSDIVHPIRQPS